MTDDGADNTTNRYGAWAIVFVYESNSKPYKNISIYDGYEGLYVSPNPSNGIFQNITKTLSGFYTPKSGDIDSTFFVFAGEGDFANWKSFPSRPGRIVPENDGFTGTHFDVRA